VTDALVAGRSVVIELDDATDDVARRVLDFTLGSAYALDATVHRTGDRTYIVDWKA
jgi:cell division inhibitor SepF